MALLSSDILEQQFGPTCIEILRQDDQTRVICTKVLATGQVLEISQVSFIKAGVDEFSDVHRIITAGESMGKAFESRNIGFTRRTKSIIQEVPSPQLRQAFNSDQPATIVVVTILVGPDQTPYANIIETYSPAVRWPVENSQ